MANGHGGSRVGSRKKVSKEQIPCLLRYKTIFVFQDGL
jgi:hypothetical protein